ncbi:MAG: hypothetical protein KDD34_09855, partial [Bdellovibrionales bacterium]|nr:hypothetical protein [Bdellovibrionales bacterium]
NKKIGIELAVTSGTKAVGQANEHLKSKNSKGNATGEIIANNLQLSFDPDVLGLQVKPETPVTLYNNEFWYLVVHSDGDEVRFELSKPYSIGDDGHVDSWKERIFFEPIPMDDIPVDKGQEDMEDDEDIVVDVSRKI